MNQTSFSTRISYAASDIAGISVAFPIGIASMADSRAPSVAEP